MNEESSKFPVNNPSYRILKDDDLMPQKGKYKDVKMIEIPAWYLLFLSDNGFCTKSVQAYITDNWDRLCREAGRPLVPGLRKNAVSSRWRG